MPLAYIYYFSRKIFFMSLYFIMWGRWWAGTLDWISFSSMISLPSSWLWSQHVIKASMLLEAEAIFPWHVDGCSWALLASCPDRIRAVRKQIKRCALKKTFKTLKRSFCIFNLWLCKSFDTFNWKLIEILHRLVQWGRWIFETQTSVYTNSGFWDGFRKLADVQMDFLMFNPGTCACHVAFLTYPMMQQALLPLCHCDTKPTLPQDLLSGPRTGRRRPAVWIECLNVMFA